MDANKAEKLAAAKKKLKQFQQKGGSKGATNGGQFQLHQQSEIDQSTSAVPVTENLKPDPEEFKINSENLYEESNHFDKNREFELLQIIETLTREKNDLFSSLKNSNNLIGELQLQLDQERSFLEKEKGKSEESFTIISAQSLREEELKHTLSILIEEKNELANNLSRNEELVKKLEEENIFQKKELDAAISSLLLLQTTTEDETEKMESNLTELTKQLESVSQDICLKNQLYGEVSEELKQFQMLHNNQSAELSQKDTIIKELSLQVELLNVNMQQLKNAGPPTVDQTLEKMQKENGILQEEIGDLREQIRTLGIEKDVLSQQYQQYILRLNGQIRTISSQAESLAVEKRNVEASLESKKVELAELEAAITVLKNNQETLSSSESLHEMSVPAETHITSQPELELSMLKMRITEMDINNEELVKLALEKESRIQELEIRIDRIQSELTITTANQDQREREKLIQAMQNDKSAASRAIAQNRQLKMQLEELEKAFIQLSNDKLILTEESQAMIRQNKEMNEKLQILDPEVAQLRQQVEDLGSQRNATIYWKQELEEAHERIQALSHQNAELKKRVIWNLNQAPVRGSRKDEVNEDHSHCSSESEGESDWVPNEVHQKLLFHYEQIEQRLKRSTATVSNLTEEKQKLDHLILQLQSETETIGEYVSLYQVQRRMLSRRAEQLMAERQKLKERVAKLTILLPFLSPQLKKFPQWLQLQPDSEPIANCEDGLTLANSNGQEVEIKDNSLDHIASGIIAVLLEITDCSSTNDTTTQPDLFPLEQLSCKPEENFHPCWPMYSGRIINI